MAAIYECTGLSGTEDEGADYSGGGTPSWLTDAGKEAVDTSITFFTTMYAGAARGARNLVGTLAPLGTLGLPWATW